MPPPVAVAFKLAVWPEIATTLNGCTVNTGRLSTLTVITVLVTFPPRPLTCTLYTPACAATTPLNANVSDVASSIGSSFNSHW